MKAIKIEFLKTLLLSDFPSGSSINYNNGRLFVVGDDSTNMLVLNSAYEKIGSIHLFDHIEKRIPKAEKIDLEASTVINIKDIDHILLVGSASRKNRKRILLIPLSAAGVPTLNHKIYETKAFVKRLKSWGIEEINLEGVTISGDHLLLANRGSHDQPENHLIITSTNFWDDQEGSYLTIKPILLRNTSAERFVGVSELCYVNDLDLLLFTLSTEDTSNAYDDGAIGDSFVGVIFGAAARLKEGSIRFDKLINLSDVDHCFKNEKIEGICVESVVADGLVIHLVSDNDKGESRLFKIKMSLSS